jgi:hypothetical protein
MTLVTEIDDRFAAKHAAGRKTTDLSAEAEALI